jgi:hypothetical protein
MVMVGLWSTAFFFSFWLDSASVCYEKRFLESRLGPYQAKSHSRREHLPMAEALPTVYLTSENLPFHTDYEIIIRI